MRPVVICPAFKKAHADQIGLFEAAGDKRTGDGQSSQCRSDKLINASD